VGSELTPEEFARVLAADLGVGGEFVSMIAHEIHEQVYRFKQDRLLDRGGFFEPEPLFSGFRPIDDAENWSPALETLTAEEHEKILEANDRSVRYVMCPMIFSSDIVKRAYNRRKKKKKKKKKLTISRGTHF